jgi:hypothetical protein
MASLPLRILLLPKSMRQPAVFANRPTRGLVALAQQTLGMTHRQFGEAIGASERTSLRWASGHASVGTRQLRELAKLVHPRDTALAASLAEAASETLESLGLVPPPPPPPVLAAVIPPALAVDLVLFAAAEALGAAPSAARGVLLAGFRRARELGLSVEEVEKALAARVSSPAVASP